MVEQNLINRQGRERERERESTTMTLLLHCHHCQDSNKEKRKENGDLCKRLYGTRGGCW